MKAPLPGRRVRGSKSGRPLMASLDLLGRRWTLRIVWELRGNVHTFRSLQGACEGISPAVLNTRVRELREAKLVEKLEEGYALTPSGRELCDALAPLQVWSQRWARSLT